ncbi:hypothetical protein [Peristeroidobacter soli]|uniref:hypothetical protein n=1 Tax=Peristeroidobacter soli TaxID=2497877 RepID=UPI00101DAE1E|nr:hypothetical protein [Peristeroidobacter soli]
MAARDFLYDERASRPAILAVVVGAHLTAFFIEWPQKRVTDSGYWGPPRSIVLIPAQPREQRPPPPLTMAPVTGAITPPPQPGLAPLDLPSEAAAPSGSAMAPPDWKQSGTDAAADAASRNYRALGPRAEAPKIKIPRSPFKPPPKHKRGELGEDALENPVLWLSENCYIRFENRKLPLDDPFRTTPMTLCTFPVGKLEPKGDLFEHLRKPQAVP